MPRGQPREHGVDARGVTAFLDVLDATPDIEPHSVMLVVHGHVVAEGWWTPYSSERPHLLYSLSKSFTSTALGMAVDEGLVSLDDTVLSHFPELDRDITDERSRRLLVRHLAAMASGHTEEALGRAQAADPDDLVRGFLLTPPDAEPGTVFAYNQPCTYTLGKIVARRSGRSLTGYLRPRLLDPLGIGEVGWLRDGTGQEQGYSGLHATTDAVARLGLLYLQGGVWGGTRLLPAWWVREATRRHVDTVAAHGSPDWQRGYGYQFWMARHGYRGDGAYGQFCVVLPDQDTVLAMTAGTENMQGILDAAWEHLLPSLPGGASTGPGGPADGAAADARLADRLRTLALAPLDAAPQPPSQTAEEWDGFTGHASSGGPLAGVSLGRRGGGWALQLRAGDAGGGGSLSGIALGTAGWAVSEASSADNTNVPVAAGGGWTDAGTFRADVLFVETPHRLRVECTVPGGGVTSGWVTEPLGAPPLHRMRSPRP